MYAKKCRKKIKRGIQSALIAITLLTVQGRGQSLLAVLDLASDGSVPKKEITAISDKISGVIADDSTYIQFERSQLPELLKQLYIEESAAACSDIQCLIIIGNLIGANFIVGGSIRRTGKETEMSLNLVNVEKKQAMQNVAFKTTLKPYDILEMVIPAKVEALMTPGVKHKSKIAASAKGKKGFFTNPLLYIGTGLAGIAAGGAYYYFHYYKQPEVDVTNEISLDDAPVRRR